MPLAAIIQLALALLPLIEKGVPEFIAWITAIKTSLQATGEWTPTQDAAYKAALFAKTKDPAYQPDP